MRVEITIETIEATNDQVELKGWTKREDGRRRNYCIIGFPADIEIPKLNSVMVLDVEFRAPETKFEPELSSPTKS